MKVLELFRPKWRHSRRAVRIKAVARVTDNNILRRIANQSDDDQVRLIAARRLRDEEMITSIARNASDASVRLDAAIAAADQSCLTAIALNEWAIQRGLKAVAFITNRLLLRRIAQSAKQDAIRLAAAVKIDHPALLKAVARSSNLIDIHWTVAKQLDDPHMMAEVIAFKPCNSRLAPLRRRAKQALSAHLGRCRRKKDTESLMKVLTSVPDITIKLEAFLHLPPEAITLSTLRFLASLDFRYVQRPLLDKVARQISSGGWMISSTDQRCKCTHCQGSGQLSLKCICANNAWGDRDEFPCPECAGEGCIPFTLLDCSKPPGEQVNLRFPQV